MKQCSRCEKERPLSDFYHQIKNSKKRGQYLYHYPYCKTCAIDASLKIQQANPDKHKEAVKKNNQTLKRKISFRENAKRRKLSGQHQEWLDKNPERQRMYTQNHSNKKHEITDEQWWECRRYFNFRCGYCDKTWEQNFKESKKDLHKEHAYNDGANDLSNCIPSCRDCNSYKWESDIDEWYTPDNPVFDPKRVSRIHRWLTEDYKKF